MAQRFDDSDPRPVRILHITDTHLHAAADGRMRGVATYETFRSTLERVRHDERWPPDAIVATGDIVQDESRRGYERFRAALEPLGVPVLSIPGNHDDPGLMQQLLDTPPFQVGGERRLGNWALILVSTFLQGEDAGGVGKERLAALDAALARNADAHVLVCMHHHPLPMRSAWLDGVGLRDAAAFLAVIDAHPQVRCVLWGHVHQASDRERRGVRYLSTPSTCAQFLPGSEFFALDERPPGFRWLRLEPDGSVVTSVEWLDTAEAPARSAP
ncbi:MAG TPA: 3',5'-cyclic-AMP phosphodiesterase [Gammaproteobacteria bacterium]